MSEENGSPFRTAARPRVERPEPTLPPLDRRAAKLVARLSSRIECLRAAAFNELFRSEDPQFWAHALIRVALGSESERETFRGLVLVAAADPLKGRCQPHEKGEIEPPRFEPSPAMHAAVRSIASTRAIDALGALVLGEPPYFGVAIAGLLAASAPVEAGDALRSSLLGHTRPRAETPHDLHELGRVLVYAVERSGGDQLVPTLAAVLARPKLDWLLARVAIVALSRHPSSDAFAVLVELAKSRADAVDAVDRMARSRAREEGTLDVLLAHPSASVRATGLILLRDSGRDDRADLFARALESEAELTNLRIALEALAPLDSLRAQTLGLAALRRQGTDIELKLLLDEFEPLARRTALPGLRLLLKDGTLDRLREYELPEGYGAGTAIADVLAAAKKKKAGEARPREWPELRARIERLIEHLERG